MAGEASVTIEELDVQAATDVLNELQPLLDGAYYDSHMFRDIAEDLEERPDPFRLFLASSDDQPVGISVVEQKFHPGYDYLGLSPIHIKRFTVAEAMRGMGIGKRLIDASKVYAFDELSLDILFGESNEYGALAAYGKKGAYYRTSTVVQTIAPKRNDPEKTLEFFARDISDRGQQNRRYVTSDGIHFAFPADEEVARFLESEGFVSQAEVVAIIG